MHIPENILKQQWERFTDRVELDVSTVQQLVAQYTGEPVKDITLLSEGCANTSYRVNFEGYAPLVLRIYARDPNAVFRERHLQKLILGKLPIPRMLYANCNKDVIAFPYALFEWVEGSLFRTEIMNMNMQAIESCCFHAGRYVNKLREIKFAKGGFFTNDFKINPFDQDNSYVPFILNHLKHPTFLKLFTVDEITTIEEMIVEYGHLMPDIHDANLAHCDFDPANIIVRRVDEEWKITGILDWEFTCSAHYFIDMGNMLRYSHNLPQAYEESFIRGIEASGHQLPREWKKAVKLMDLMSLLSLAEKNSDELRPAMFGDIMNLVHQTVKDWDSY